MSRLRLLFGSAVFLASFLLFLVEPIGAKQLLPILGGSASIWITCLVFFQTALLCAYLYAHWFTRHPHWRLHVFLLAAALALAFFWAFGSIDLSGGAAHPVTTVFLALSIWIGLPFLALGATSPLLQLWWAQIERSPIPWRLFALSNLASLLALALYPTLIEPTFTLHTQRMAWSCAFAAFAILAAFLSHRTRTAAVSSPAVDDLTQPPSPLVHKLLWLLLPMGASMQLSAVTIYLTANIAPIPLLWILPLGVYLITLILAFQFSRLLPQTIVTGFLVVMLASLGYMLSKPEISVPMRIGIFFFLFELLAAGLFLHSRAFVLRPRRASESTVFYLFFAAGGAIGSFLIGIVFPLLFSFNYDLALTFFVTALLALAAASTSGEAASGPAPRRWTLQLLWAATSIMLLVLVCWLHITAQRGVLVAVRNFYGALRVEQNYGYPGATVRTLLNGSIQHGTQIFASDELRKTPTSYYARDSGLGLALRFCCQGRARNIGIIGLGAGTIAAYGRAGDRIRFYEINPAVEPIARNVFTYLRESGAKIDIVTGDARTSLAREEPQNFDVLVVDAFSGDAIPLHLLTAQALALYRRNLAPGGIIAFHISNQHVDLEPAIALLAADSGMTVRSLTTPSNDKLGEFTAVWVLVASDPAFFSVPGIVDSAPSLPVLQPGLRLWTDDYSSLLPLLHW